MFRKVLMLMTTALFCLASQVEAEVIHSTWVGDWRGFWKNESNWDPPIVPDNDGWRSFVVSIDSDYIGVGHIEILLEYSRTIDRLDSHGEVQLIGYNWKYEPVLKILEPDHGLENHHYLELHEINIEGDIYTHKGTRLGNIRELRVLEGTFYNHGSMVASPTTYLWAEYEFHNFDVIEMYGGLCSSDRPFTNESTGVIKGCGFVHSDELINNAGLIQSFGGCLALHSRVDFEGPYIHNRGLTNTGTLTNSPGTSLTAMIWVANMTNQGTIEVNANGAVVFDSHLVNEPNAVIKLLGGTLAAKTITQLTGATFEGFGGITGNVAIDPNGIIKLTGPTNIVGDVNIPAGATLEISDGQTLITGHTTNNGEIRVVNGKVVFQGGYSGSGIVKKE